MDSSRQQLRQRYRRQRRALSRGQQRVAATALQRNVASYASFYRHQDLAFYLACDGEIDPWPLLLRAHRQKRRCYLPVLAPNGGLWFVRFNPGDKLTNNRFGIPEPAKRRRRRKPWTLGLMLMPLVAFDRSGGRLGMGGGFYDRALSGIKRHPQMPKPTLLGLGHHFQQHSGLSVEPWDVQLSQVATDKAFIDCG